MGMKMERGGGAEKRLASFVSVSIGTPEVAIRHKVNKITDENLNNHGTAK